MACFDVQAIPAIERGVGRYWYPHVSTAVVLAVDRTRTDAVITGWNSLWKSPDPVAISGTTVIRNMLALGALSYGLNPEEPSKWDALELLEHLSQNGKFKLDAPDAPILLCWTTRLLRGTEMVPIMKSSCRWKERWPFVWDCSLMSL